MWLLGAEGAVCDLHSCLGDAGGLQRQALSRGGHLFFNRYLPKFYLLLHALRGAEIANAKGKV